MPNNDLPTVLELYDRAEAHWTNDTMKNVLSHKLRETNEEYSLQKKKYNQLKQIPYSIAYVVWTNLKALVRRI